MTRGPKTTSEPKLAPGKPGEPPRWAPASKDGVGTSLGGSPLWFTVGRGAIEEVFYPGPDQPRIAGMSLTVADGESYVSDERTDATHRVQRPDYAVPLYRLTNQCRSGRYEIEKSIFTHPAHNVLIQDIAIRSQPPGKSTLSVYVHLDPRLSDDPGKDTAWLADLAGRPMLVASGGGCFVALACSAHWSVATVGFAGTSDGRVDLAKNRRLTEFYHRAEEGTVSLTGAISLDGCDGRFVLALGFGDDPDCAAREAISGLSGDRQSIRELYRKAWFDWQAKLDIPAAAGKTERDLARVSATVIRTHMASRCPGAIVASLTTPWGNAQTPDSLLYSGGYHLVWPRDQVEAAGGLLAVGAIDEARLALDHLRASQSCDGHWPQNLRCDGTKNWDGVQLGETALPILLADRLRREGGMTAEEAKAFWPTVRKAISYIVTRGPSTQEDRWENQQGYTPFTIAVVIAALIVAADAAELAAESAVATYLRETADAWNAAIDDWLYVEGTKLAHQVGVDGYYLRIAPRGWAEEAATGTGKLDPTSAPDAESGFRVTEVVSPDALALVRFGIRKADDPRIVATVKAIDATLKVETPRGPSWHRYSGDGYGEQDDGTPFVKRNRSTHGRAWPLLTGERAHYELAAGRIDAAIRLLRAMESLASDSGMISEQVWDEDDLPAAGMFRGRPTGSAMPLAWAHAEYLTLRRSIAFGRIADCPPQTARRYAAAKTHSPLVTWRTDHRRRFIPKGKTLRIELPEPARVDWGIDGQGLAVKSVTTTDTTVGMHIADLPVEDVPRGARVRFEIKGPDVKHYDIRIARG